MKVFTVAIFIVSLITLVTAQNWDYLTFSQEWPPAFCKTSSCNYPATEITGWNIHGLWPSNSNGSDPHNCKTGLPFNQDSIEDLKSKLEVQWCNLKDFGNPFEFWEYEWDKHGRCAVTDLYLNSELNYFNASLTYKFAVNLTENLAAANILPSNSTYEKSQILTVLNSTYGVGADIRCIKYNDENYWYETRLCFDQTFKLINCPKDNLYFKGDEESGAWEDIDYTEECPDSFYYAPFSY